ncbi:MAG: ABC transporter substrate-binding protein, partial [Microbacterium sp.]
MKIRSTAVTLAAIGATALVLSGCTSGGDSNDSDSITFWVQEDLPDRVAATEDIVAGFEDESGIEVEVVSVAEDQFAQLITSSAAAGDLPDVIGGISLPQVRTLSANELVDTDAVGAVIEALDASTFSEKALELTADGDTQLAVPSESWLQMLFYRTDLFEAAGLDAPDTYDKVLEAAAALDSAELAGFVGATAPGDAFTEQTFEQVALGNNCQLVNADGEIELDSSQCVESFEFYGDLISNYSVPGAQDVDTTRATYFAGEAAMFIWSSFVLDEMAGLRADAMPN